jgi:hypothetical protein
VFQLYLSKIQKLKWIQARAGICAECAGCTGPQILGGPDFYTRHTRPYIYIGKNRKRWLGRKLTGRHLGLGTHPCLIVTRARSQRRSARARDTKQPLAYEPSSRNNADSPLLQLFPRLIRSIDPSGKRQRAERPSQRLATATSAIFSTRSRFRLPLPGGAWPWCRTTTGGKLEPPHICIPSDD